MRWPEGPPHLALNPSYFFIVWFCFCFCFPCLSLLLIDKQPCFPPRKGHFCLFSMFLFLFPLTFFGFPPFSVSLSLSLSFSCLSFFLLCLSFCFFFVSCFCLFFIFLSSLFLFHEKNNMKIFNCNLFFPRNIFFFFLVSCLAFSFQSLSLIFVFFPDFKLCFLFNINVFAFEKQS